MLNFSLSINRTNIVRVNTLIDIDKQENIVEIEEIKDLICWNCSEKGHLFEDCVGERKIFCYGCSTPNIFKPNCSKCNTLHSGDFCQNNGNKSKRLHRFG